MSLKTRLAASNAMQAAPGSLSELARRILKEDELQQVLRRCSAVAILRHWDIARTYLRRAAILYFDLSGEPMPSLATVAESDTRTIVQELRRRALEERDVAAARALKITLPKKEKARVSRT